MAGKKKRGNSTTVTDYQYPDKTRKNIPPAGLAAQGKLKDQPKIQYSYNPHLPPVLRFDASGQTDQLTERAEALLDKATREPLNQDERDFLAQALRARQPWLEWSGKREREAFGVDPVALHIHERVSAQAVLRAAKREDIQRDLFADPQQDYAKATQFYQHDIAWANRLILGDSLHVMTSLAKREALAGKVQMIYIDPPYGIRFSSNWQNEVGQLSVKDRDEDLTREPEMIKAYQDTFRLGVHSYLDYLKQRLIVARDLLADSGSVFVQISDQNLHHVRELMDEVFGYKNFAALITFSKTGGQTDQRLASVADYILWYSKNSDRMTYHQLYADKEVGGDGGGKYTQAFLPDGQAVPLSRCRVSDNVKDVRVFRKDTVTSQRPPGSFPVTFCDRAFTPEPNYWKTSEQGFRRLASANRLAIEGRRLAYVRFFADFPVFQITNVWDEIGGIQSRSDPKVYVVQTATTAIERCMLMTTQPGDLVLDPTCGSGTTAYVAEQWGRRWITIDTSRVALAIARQRLLTATFPVYKTQDFEIDMDGQVTGNPGSGFVYKSVPHITLKSIAQNVALDPIFARHEPILDGKLTTLNDALARHADDNLRERLVAKLADQIKTEGKRSITDADRRRWLLPGTSAALLKPALAERKLKDAKLADAIPLEPHWRDWEVPFDTDPDWPATLQAALTDYRQAWRAKMDEVNACIDANAESVDLVDQPEEVRNTARVSGPFTVESVRPLEESLKGHGEPEVSPIGGAPDALETVFDDAGEVHQADSTNAASHIDRMLALLRDDGLTLIGNRKIDFERLDPIEHSFIHAEGEFTSEDGKVHRAAVVIGPEYGPVTGFQVEQATRSAFRRGYDDLVFAGFSFDDAAQAAIQETNEEGEMLQHMALIRPDVVMGDLLKKTQNSQLFTVFGQPRVRLDPQGFEYVVHMEGVDVYDPVKNSLQSTKAGKVAAWFLDSDYDGRTFCICQAFFPDRAAWGKLAKALKGALDEAALEAFNGTVSLPFKPGRHKRVAVKVIDPRGNEVMAVRRLDAVHVLKPD